MRFGIVIKLPARLLSITALIANESLQELEILDCTHCFIINEYLRRAGNADARGNYSHLLRSSLLDIFTELIFPPARRFTFAYSLSN